MERDGYYDVYKFRGVPPKVKEKLETGEASSLVLVSMFSNIAHKYRLGKDVLRGTFSTYFLQQRHPMHPLVDKVLVKLRDTGILLKFRLK